MMFILPIMSTRIEAQKTPMVPPLVSRDPEVPVNLPEVPPRAASQERSEHHAIESSSGTSSEGQGHGEVVSEYLVSTPLSSSASSKSSSRRTSCTSTSSVVSVVEVPSRWTTNVSVDCEDDEDCSDRGQQLRSDELSKIEVIERVAEDLVADVIRRSLIIVQQQNELAAGRVSLTTGSNRRQITDQLRGKPRPPLTQNA